MKLRNVIKNIEIKGDPQISDIDVSGVAYDSRKVKSEPKRFLFSHSKFISVREIEC